LTCNTVETSSILFLFWRSQVNQTTCCHTSYLHGHIINMHESFPKVPTL
jgi:hypothetical protein